MKLGTNDIGSVYLGTNAVQKVYLGTNEVWSSYAYLLDDYSGAAAAYSLRLLRSAYTGNAIRVRRSSDSNEADIAFVDNVLDTESLLTFCGSGNGFVKTWYDQSGNANHATQSTAANQPQIVSNGSVLTLTGVGSAKPILRFDGVNDGLNFSTITAPQFTTFYPQKKNANADKGAWFANGTSNGVPYTPIIYGSLGTYIGNQTKSTNSSTYNNNNYILISGYINSSNNGFIQINGSSITLGNQFVDTGSNSFNTINTRASVDFSKCDVPEMIFYNFDNSSNISAINANINDYYGIY